MYAWAGWPSWRQTLSGLFRWLIQLDSVWLVDLHEYRARFCDSEMQMHTNHRLIKTTVGLPKIGLFALLPGDRKKMYVVAPSWCVSERLSRSFWYRYCPSLHTTSVWCDFKADKALLWRIAILKFLAFVLISFVAAAQEGISMSKTVDPQFFVEGLDMLVPIHDRLANWINDLCFFAIICKTEFKLILS